MNGRWIGLTLAAWPAAAMAQTAMDDPGRPDAVVTARPTDAAAALRACLARHCPPEEDIKATLDQAATQFVNGDYRESRATLYAARKRNGRFARQYPVQVARLHSAIAMVSAHLGDRDATWNGRLDAIDALKAGLPDSDPRVLLGRLDLADGYVFDRRLNAALEEYLAAADAARKADLPNIEWAARLRRAQLLVGMREANGPAYKVPAQTAVTALTGLTDPSLAPYVTAGRRLQARLDTIGRKVRVDDVVAAFRADGRASKPQLLYAPEIRLGESAAAADNVEQQNSGTELSVSRNTLGQTATANFDKQWIDVAFEIQADGRVADVRVARQSPSLSGDWARVVTGAIAGRRYAPMRIEGGDRVARLERYTLTSLLYVPTGSRIKIRSSKPVLQAIDLSGTVPG